MLSQEGRAYLELVPTLALWPGLALTLTVFGANMFGDALRDLARSQAERGRGALRQTSHPEKEGGHNE